MKPDIIHIAALEAKDARIKELEDWKAEAMTVLGQWHDLVKSLPKDFVGQPKFLGASQSTVVGACIADLTTEGMRLREALTSSITQLEVINDLYPSVAPSLPRSIMKLKLALGKDPS